MKGSLGAKCTIGFVCLVGSCTVSFLFFQASLVALIFVALRAYTFNLAISTVRRVEKFGKKGPDA